MLCFSDLSVMMWVFASLLKFEMTKMSCELLPPIVPDKLSIVCAEEEEGIEVEAVGCEAVVCNRAQSVRMSTDSADFQLQQEMLLVAGEFQSVSQVLAMLASSI